VREGAPERTGVDLDPDLLQELPLEALLDGLRSAALAPGKLPAPALVVVVMAARDQYLGARPDDPRGNLVASQGAGHAGGSQARARLTYLALFGTEAFFNSLSRKARVRFHASFAASSR
jgi:hypothetical protein